MSTQELISKEVENLPEALQREVYDFVRFLREKPDEGSKIGKLPRKMPHGQTCSRQQ